MSASHAIHRARRVAERQHGNITRAQLRHAGWDRHTIERRIADGWLVVRHREVYAFGHAPRSRRSRWMAAVLAFGDGAVLSHRAAGAYWELVRGGVPTEVIVPTRHGRARRDGLVVHRIPLRPDEALHHRDVPVTSLIRTVIDLATVQSWREFERTFEQAQVLHGLKPEPLAVEAIARRGFRGNRNLARVLVDAVDPAGVASILELRFLRLCARHDLPTPLVNVRRGRWTPDFAWPDAKLLVETDGDRFHRTPRARRRDRERDDEHRAAGLHTLRLTWADVTTSPTATAARVQAALVRGG